MDDLIERLQAGCIYRPKRWSGDTHDDLGGPIDEAATESLLAEAAAALSQQRAVPEGYVLIGKPMLRGMIGDEAMAQIEAACVYPVAAAIAEGEQE